MRALSIACLRRSAARRWWERRRSFIPAPTTGHARGVEPIMLRLASLALLVTAWSIGSWTAGEQMLPAPTTVLTTVIAEARSGELFFHLAATLARVAVAFTLAMT